MRVVAPNQHNENETIARHEIMDGAPIRGTLHPHYNYVIVFSLLFYGPFILCVKFVVGETIPLRLFLTTFPLTPTFRDVNKKFSVRYYLNLVLVDEENRRYFKQQEITLFRIREKDEVPVAS